MNTPTAPWPGQPACNTLGMYATGIMIDAMVLRGNVPPTVGIKFASTDELPAGTGAPTLKTTTKEIGMLSKQALCLRIREIYPDIGACGIDIKAEYDDQQDRWRIHLTKNDKQLTTFLEREDVELCMAGKQCVGLSIEVNQLRDSIDRMPAR